MNEINHWECFVITENFHSYGKNEKSFSRSKPLSVSLLALILTSSPRCNFKYKIYVNEINCAEEMTSMYSDIPKEHFVRRYILKKRKKTDPFS